MVTRPDVAGSRLTVPIALRARVRCLDSLRSAIKLSRRSLACRDGTSVLFLGLFLRTTQHIDGF